MQLCASVCNGAWVGAYVLELMDTFGPPVVQVKDPGSSCLSVALSRDTTRCAVGYSSGAIRVFDVDKIDLEAKFVAHESGVVQLMYVPRPLPPCVPWTGAWTVDSPFNSALQVFIGWPGYHLGKRARDAGCEQRECREHPPCVFGSQGLSDYLF
jgi:hypothetical protein